MALAIFFTGDLLRECAFSSRTSAFDQVRRLVRLARLLAINPLVQGTPQRHRSIAELVWDEKIVEELALRWHVSSADQPAFAHATVKP
jgi:hypothetical protein